LEGFKVQSALARSDETSQSAGDRRLMNLSPGSKLGPYEILSPLGSGGMGEVWKARDTRLGRVVAIKKAREQHSERFKQEARSIASLNHTNICQLFDIGPDYLVLEYVEGKPLSSPLPEKEAIRLAIQIATALEAAHKKGIIHRDLKPGNILVTDEGLVKLLDFGLAKLYEQNASTSDLPTADYAATQAGTVLGTVAYMSPEQAQGLPVDARSDIFTFGLVLYEMLSGRRAFSSGESPVATALALVKDAPSPLQASPALEKIVQRCLAKQPSARYQTIPEVKSALEQVSQGMEAKSSKEPQPSIAVLPFVNMSGDKEQEYFSDGLAEEIINALAQIPGLQVIARTSAFAFKGRQEDITKIAEALRVNTILEGSVRKAGNRIRITAQLIDATRGTHLWSERYDREMTDVFAIQDEISQVIADKLRVSQGRSPVKRYTDNLDAYNLYLRGRYYYLMMTPDGFAKSKMYLEQAIAMDPDDALAWFGLAQTYWFSGFLGFTQPKAIYAEVLQATLKALELDDMLPEAHAMMAILRFSDFDWEGCEREFRRARELGPEPAFVLWAYSSFYLSPMGRIDEAIATCRKALELDPLSPLLQWWLAYGYFCARQHDRTINQCRNLLELYPNYWHAYILTGVSNMAKNRIDEAIQAFETAVQHGGRDTTALAYLGLARGFLRRFSEATAILDELNVLAREKYVPPTNFAWVYFGLGEGEKAFDWLEKALEEKDGMVMNVLRASHPSIHSHPRYHALLRKMNLEA
jgi:serine/threonine protein kinase/Tfp pilus assembly protein PilF